MRRQADPKTKSQEVGHIAEIKNATAINNGKLPLKDLGVTALSKTKLRITLTQKTPWFNSRLAAELYPLNEKFTEKYGSNYGSSAAKTLSDGPYVLKNWNGTSDTWTYAKNKDYYDKKSVRIKTVDVQTVKDVTTAQNLFASNSVQQTTLTGTQVQAASTGKLAKELHITKSNRLATWIGIPSIRRSITRICGWL